MFAALRFTVAVSLFVACAARAESPDPVRVPVNFNASYVPQGFDSNDRVQLVGEGEFQNSCYRPAPVQTQVDEASRTVTVTPTAYEYSGVCLQVILPFDRVVDVGVLKAGTWLLKQNDGAELGKIEVAQAARSEPDEHLYAPISQAFVDTRGLRAIIRLSGNFPNNCMRLDDVKVDVQPKAVVVQPIVSMASRPGCRNGSFPFRASYSTRLNRPGRYLLHVRSMNGNSVNSLFDVNG